MTGSGLSEWDGGVQFHLPGFAATTGLELGACHSVNGASDRLGHHGHQIAQTGKGQRGRMGRGKHTRGRGAAFGKNGFGGGCGDFQAALIVQAAGGQQIVKQVRAGMSVDLCQIEDPAGDMLIAPLARTLNVVPYMKNWFTHAAGTVMVCV
jgi:hypothetical protein